jgi:flagellar hook protein FlgE
VELNSMADALSGLQANQTYMDVVGNNISNVNTTAYKTQNIHFSDLLNDTLGYGSPASAQPGGLEGIDPVQVGMGVGQGSVNIVNTQGSVQDTGRPTDLAIHGGGYFILNDGKQNYFTRDGSFTIAKDGTLENGANGMKVQGWNNTGSGITTTGAPSDIKVSLTDPTNPNSQLKSFSVGKDGTIVGVYDDGNSQPIAQLAMSDFSNPDGLIRDGDNLYTAGVNSGPIKFGASTYATAGTGTLGTIASGELEGSNVDLAAQFANMIQAQQGFNANTKVITTTNNMMQSVISIVP